MPKRFLEGLGATLVVLVAGIAAIIGYQFSLEINRPLPDSTVKWSDSQVATETRRYILEGITVHEDRLVSISSRTLKTVLDILAENSGIPDFIKPTPGSYGSHKTPLSRACYLLPNNVGSATANPLLLPFLSVDDTDARRTALRQIVVTGHDSSLPAIDIGLRSEELLSTTLDWMTYPIWDGTMSPKAEQRIWSTLEELVRSSDEPKQAALVMIELNEQRANQFLTTPELFGFHNPRFGQILAAYDRANILIDRELLLPQIEQLETQTTERSRPFYSYQLLVHLALWEHPDDGDLIEGLTEHEDEAIAEKAAEALLVWHDIPYGMVDLEKASNVPPEILIHEATSSLIYNARDYGFFEYFDSLSGDDWRHARHGLDALGADRSAAVFDAAVAVFGETEPEARYSDRRPQIEGFTDAQLDRLRELSAEWLTCNERLKVRLALYVLKNRKIFEVFERSPL